MSAAASSLFGEQIFYGISDKLRQSEQAQLYKEWLEAAWVYAGVDAAQSNKPLVSITAITKFMQDGYTANDVRLITRCFWEVHGGVFRGRTPTIVDLFSTNPMRSWVPNSILNEAVIAESRKHVDYSNVDDYGMSGIRSVSN